MFLCLRCLVTVVVTRCISFLISPVLLSIPKRERGLGIPFTRLSKNTKWRHSVCRELVDVHLRIHDRTTPFVLSVGGRSDPYTFNLSIKESITHKTFYDVSFFLSRDSWILSF